MSTGIFKVDGPMPLLRPWSFEGVLVVLFVGLGLWTWRWSRHKDEKASVEKTQSQPVDPKTPIIKELPGFNWEATEPLKFRSFIGKDKYNLTMAIENLDPSELIPMDKTYKDRLAMRKELLEKQHDIVVAVHEPPTPDTRIREAVSELYTFILKTYIPTRYPTMFKIHPSATIPDPETVENLVTGDTWPTTLSNSTPTIHALEILAQTVDEEFLILLPDLSPPDDQPKYMLQAYATCFPSGFNTREKLGLRLADIHAPVPGYAEKIERSMDRFFARVEVGRFVKRVNWSVAGARELFAAFGHGRNGGSDGDAHAGTLDPGEMVLRCERQTLHRLPMSRALIFSFHTYMYPLRDIKDEGLGEELAVAIDGLKSGNVPAIHSYKRADQWGDAVKEFLRS